MSAQSRDDVGTTPTTGPDATSYERYAGIDVEDGETIIYDLDTENAWIQSTLVLSLEAMR